MLHFLVFLFDMGDFGKLVLVVRFFLRRLAVFFGAFEGVWVSVLFVSMKNELDLNGTGLTEA